MDLADIEYYITCAMQNDVPWLVTGEELETMLAASWPEPVTITPYYFSTDDHNGPNIPIAEASKECFEYIMQNVTQSVNRSTIKWGSTNPIWDADYFHDNAILSPGADDVNFAKGVWVMGSTEIAGNMLVEHWERPLFAIYRIEQIQQ